MRPSLVESGTAGLGRAVDEMLSALMAYLGLQLESLGQSMSKENMDITITSLHPD
jgi:hypothetical protein